MDRKGFLGRLVNYFSLTFMNPKTSSILLLLNLPMPLKTLYVELFSLKTSDCLRLVRVF